MSVQCLWQVLWTNSKVLEKSSKTRWKNKEILWPLFSLSKLQILKSFSCETIWLIKSTLITNAASNESSRETKVHVRRIEPTHHTFPISSASTQWDFLKCDRQWKLKIDSAAHFRRLHVAMWVFMPPFDFHSLCADGWILSFFRVIYKLANPT